MCHTFDNSEFTIYDAALDHVAQGPETSAVNLSPSHLVQIVTKHDEALLLAPNRNYLGPTSKMEEALLLMNDANIINDEELFLLQEANIPCNLHLGLFYWKYERFNLEDMRDNE